MKDSTSARLGHPSSNDVTVLIVGGGIAGLCLANCLEQAQVPYLLWDRTEDLHADHGAMLGTMPNGLSILDQLGMKDEIGKNAFADLQSWDHTRTDGSLIKTINAWSNSEQEFGYPMWLLERSEMHRILYENIKDKSRIVTSKKVISVVEQPDRVVVVADDLTVVTCDLAAGADGVRSQVRQELQRLASSTAKPASESPEYLQATVNCVYGGSKKIEGVESGKVCTAYRENESFIVFGGVDCAYWFVFETRDQTKPFSYERPNLTSEDADRICAKVANIRVNDRLTFGDVYAQRSIVFVAPLEEGVAEHWTSSRMALIGDSAHKMAINMAQGGNQAIESTAALANRIVELHRKQQASGSPNAPIPAGDLSAALQSYVEERKPRVTPIVGAVGASCRAQLKMGEASQKFLDALPNMTDEDWMNKIRALLAGSPKLNFLPVPAVRDAKKTESLAPTKGEEPIKEEEPTKDAEPTKDEEPSKDEQSSQDTSSQQIHLETPQQRPGLKETRRPSQQPLFDADSVLRSLNNTSSEASLQNDQYCEQARISLSRTTSLMAAGSVS